LPTPPMLARFLTDNERVLAVHRIRANKIGILNRNLKWHQIKEALNPFRDPQIYLFPSFATALFICLSLPGVNSSGYMKRITLSSYAFLGYALGNINAPFMVKVGETPAYRSVFFADIICIILQGIFLILLRIYYVRENRRRDQLLAEGQVQNAPEDEFADKTDLELLRFRYVVSRTQLSIVSIAN
ncbi:hypothetical protein DL95DRAFT_300526, partial [Leptodontidium sp. 2 PMI_412]